MIQCEKCKEPNRDNAKYCMYCGHELPIQTNVNQSINDTTTEQPKKKKFNTPTFIGIIVGLAVMVCVQQYVTKSYTPSVDKILVAGANEVNKMCPLMVDAETRLDNAIALPNNTFQYNYTLINVLQSSIDTIQLKHNIEPGIINLVKTNPQMKIFRDKEVTINYSYKDKTGIYLCSIAVRPEQYK